MTRSSVVPVPGPTLPNKEKNMGKVRITSLFLVALMSLTLSPGSTPAQAEGPAKEPRKDPVIERMDLVCPRIDTEAIK
jgi:hypothetical protein